MSAKRLRCEVLAAMVADVRKRLLLTDQLTGEDRQTVLAALAFAEAQYLRQARSGRMPTGKTPLTQKERNARRRNRLPAARVIPPDSAKISE